MKEILVYIREVLTKPINVFGTDLPFSLASILLKFILPIVLALIIYKILKILTKKSINKTKLQDEVKNKIQYWVFLILKLSLLVSIISVIANFLGAKIGVYFSGIYTVLSKPFFTSGSSKVSFITLIFTVPVFYFASWASQITRVFVNNNILNKLNLDESKKFSVSSLIKYGVMVFVVIIGLSVIGIDLSALTVIFGVLGLGIGFGLQKVVANFFAGLIIIINRPIKEGDRIFVESTEGDVLQIRILSTVITTLTNETIIIPNSHLVDNVVHNYSYEDRRVFTINEVDVSYNSDLEKVVSVLNEIALRNPLAVSNKKPIVRIAAFGDSGIKVKLLTMIKDADLKYESVSWANMEIWRDFKSNDIEIPFPQMDLHIKDKL